MKKATPQSWTDTSPIPKAKRIPTPNFPNRAGVAAQGTAILVFVALFCIFQYWLLTATLEAYHAGDDALPLGAFLASLGCFILAAGLTLMGEIALLKQQDYLRQSGPSSAAGISTLRTEQTTSPEPGASTSAAEHFRDKGTGPAGGGDAG